MCGIAGYWKSERRLAAHHSLLPLMCDRLKHRGPDAYGEFRDGDIALGHQRLSIIDVAGGQQPLGNEDGTVQVAFNGEIYNFRELRQQLVDRGHQFQTNSDTEVLVHLYEDVGDRLPEYLNGMFAFAIWDIRKQELFIARDRFGKKPLYYTDAISGLRFCFASELKAIIAVPGFNASVNARAVADFLSLSYVPDPATIFDGVHKLPPAHAMRVSRNSTRVWRYWNPDHFVQHNLRFDDAVEQLHELAADSVARRMISDVPLGAFLSGGVDSTAAVGFMAAQVPGRVKTFSIGFTDRNLDELQYARMAVDRHGTEHHEQVVTPAIEDVLDELVEHYDEPFGDSSAIPMLYLARMTREHVTVALSGDGADEIFGGYRRYTFGVLEHRLRQKFPDWFRRSVFRIAGQYYPKFDYLPQVFRAKTLLGNLSQELADAYFTSMSTFRDQGLETLLSTELSRDLGGYSTRESYRERFRSVRHLDPLSQMQAVDRETYLPGDILVKADRATMAHSLESRSPWLDYRIAELAYRMPAAYKLHGHVGKRVFKTAVSAYVPKPLITRKKMGFSVPLASWFRTSLKPVFERQVLSGDVDQFCSIPEIRRIWNEHLSGLHNHDRKLWNLLMLASWNTRYGSRRYASEFATTLS